MDYFRRRDDSTSTFLMGVASGLALGALAMFIFDPQQGRARRAMARDKAMRYGREVGDLASRTTKDLTNLVREKTGTQTEPAVQANPGTTIGGI
jgi:gas vesicle protein